jgi:hypothetical protein
MRLHIYRKGFDRVTGMAWLLCFPRDEKSGLEFSTSRYTLMMSWKNPTVIVRPGYDPPQMLERTAKGWVEYENESKLDHFGEVVTYTSRTGRIIGADEELDYLQVALLSVVPHPLLVSFAQRCMMV